MVGSIKKIKKGRFKKRYNRKKKKNLGSYHIHPLNIFFVYEIEANSHIVVLLAQLKNNDQSLWYLGKVSLKDIFQM